MKVSDLLSSATIGSSRALSTFAATVLLVHISGVRISEVPVIEFLDLTERQANWVVTLLLAFLVVTHNINFRTDRLDAAVKEHDERAKTFAAMPPGEERELEVMSLEYRDDVKKAQSLARESRKEQKRYQYYVVFVLHLYVPMGLTMIALAATFIRIWPATWETIKGWVFVG